MVIIMINRRGLELVCSLFSGCQICLDVFFYSDHLAKSDASKKFLSYLKYYKS